VQRRQQRGKQQKARAERVAGDREHRQRWMQQQQQHKGNRLRLTPGISSRRAGPLLGKRLTNT